MTMEQPTMTVKVNTQTQMTNEELAKAIDVAHDRSGSATEDQQTWHEHLVALLEIQRRRADAVYVVDDCTDPAK